MVEIEKEKVIENNVPKPLGRKLKEYQHEYAEIASRLTASGFSEQDVAYALGVSLKSIKSWKHGYSEFKEACEQGRKSQKKRLLASAVKQATGYNYIDKNIKRTYNAAGELLKTEESEFHKEQPADGRMLLFLLCNIDRQLGDNEWKSVKNIEVEETKNVNINLPDAANTRDRIRQLAGALLGEERKRVESKVIE